MTHLETLNVLPHAILHLSAPVMPVYLPLPGSWPMTRASPSTKDLIFSREVDLRR